MQMRSLCKFDGSIRRSIAWHQRRRQRNPADENPYTADNVDSKFPLNWRNRGLAREPLLVAGVNIPVVVAKLYFVVSCLSNISSQTRSRVLRNVG